MYRQAIQDLVTKFVYDTANVTVMAYGQTGAGKTHTMIGKTQPPGDDDRGVIPRSANISTLHDALLMLLFFW